MNEGLDIFLKRFHEIEVLPRKLKIAENLKLALDVVSTILSYVELREPRFKGDYLKLEGTKPTIPNGYEHHSLYSSVASSDEESHHKPTENIINNFSTENGKNINTNINVNNKNDLNVNDSIHCCKLTLEHFINNSNKNNYSEVEIQPFDNSFLVDNGIRILSPNKFEIFLYLNHTGAFNLVYLDNLDCNFPGSAALKLVDGRKRSMSLWVEFITASGFLSSRKLRNKFKNLVMQVITEKFDKTFVHTVEEKNGNSGTSFMDGSHCYNCGRTKVCNDGIGEKNTSCKNSEDGFKSASFSKFETEDKNFTNGCGSNDDVIFCVNQNIEVIITLAFRCPNMWPNNMNSAIPRDNNWFSWELLNAAKTKGFDLLSKKINRPFEEIENSGKKYLIENIFNGMDNNINNKHNHNKNTKDKDHNGCNEDNETPKSFDGNKNNNRFVNFEYCRKNKSNNVCDSYISSVHCNNDFAFNNCSMINNANNFNVKYNYSCDNNYMNANNKLKNGCSTILSNEDDAWLISLDRPEDMLLNTHNRQMCFDFFETFREKFFTDDENSFLTDFEFVKNNSHESSIVAKKNINKKFILMDNFNNAKSTNIVLNSILSASVIRNIVILESFKHPEEECWTNYCLKDRIISLTMEILANLLSAECFSYFNNRHNFFKAVDKVQLRIVSRRVWAFLRKLIFISSSCGNIDANNKMFGYI